MVPKIASHFSQTIEITHSAEGNFGSADMTDKLLTCKFAVGIFYSKWSLLWLECSKTFYFYIAILFDILESEIITTLDRPVVLTKLRLIYVLIE